MPPIASVSNVIVPRVPLPEIVALKSAQQALATKLENSIQTVDLLKGEVDELKAQN